MRRNSRSQTDELVFFFKFLFLDFLKKNLQIIFSLVVRSCVFEQIDLQLGLFGKKKKDGAVP